jgi:hypothetical protein
MRGGITPLTNTPSLRGAQLKTQGQLYLYLTVYKSNIWHVYVKLTSYGYLRKPIHLLAHYIS